MTREKVAVLAFNLKHSWFAKWKYKRLIRKHKNYTPILLEFSGGYTFAIVAIVDNKRCVIVESPDSSYFTPGEVIDTTYRHCVEITESDIV